ncbi:MAG: OmpA family protein, partial [Geminicoccaceae bacterium]
AALEAARGAAESRAAGLADELAQARTALAEAVDRMRELELEALKLETKSAEPFSVAVPGDVFESVGRILLEGVVPFALGRADLGPMGERTLSRFLDELRAAIAERSDTDWRIEVEGRTDARPITRAAFESNEALAAARAKAVADRLVAEGLPRERLRLLSRPGDRPGGGDERVVVIRLVAR